MDLPTVWFVLLGVFMVGYAVLDGFDLGVGILHLLARGENERRAMLDSIGPFWDGNVVWLVVFGGALFAAFPAAYAAAFTTMYLPFMLLLVALIFRAVAIEFRHHSDSRAGRLVWDVLFSVASIVVTFIFGLAVGNAISGVPLGPGGTIQQEGLALVRPYPLLVALFAVATFAMHGATYLRLRTSGELCRRALRWSWWSFRFFLTLYLATSAVTLVEFPAVVGNFQRSPWLWFVPLLNALAIANLPRSLWHDRPQWAFVSSGATIAAFTFLFGAALFPNLITSSLGSEFNLTVWKAASSDGTLWNLLIATGLGLPFVMGYTVITYWVFRKPADVYEYEAGHDTPSR